MSNVDETQQDYPHKHSFGMHHEGASSSSVEAADPSTEAQSMNVPNSGMQPIGQGSGQIPDASFQQPSFSAGLSQPKVAPQHVNPIFAMQSSFQEAQHPASPDEFSMFDQRDSGEVGRSWDVGMQLPYTEDHVAKAPDAQKIQEGNSSRFGAHGHFPIGEHRNNFFLTAVVYVLVALYACWEIFGTAYDNDIWFILATGREIIDNGIPYTNPFSLHENMGIIVQQWLVCVISYGIYSFSGFVGLGVWVLILFAIMTFSFYKVSRILRNDKFGSEIIAIIFLPLTIVLSTYSSVRPHLYTMIAFLWIVGLLTLYRRTSKIAYIIPLPFIVALHVNFQSSMAPFDIVIMVCFLIPNFIAPIQRRGKLLNWNFISWDYKRVPLLVVTLVSVVALLANPYFIDGALYLVKSFGSASYRNYISEMNALTPATNYVYVIALLFFVVTAVVVGSQGVKRINFPMLLLACGTTALSFTQIRNIWLGPLFCALYLVSIGAHRSIGLFVRNKAAKIVGWAAIAIGAIGCCLLIAYGASNLEQLPENDADTPVAALDYLDEIGADKDKTRILNFFNSGGYFEYRGYKVVMDPRPELWSPAITGLDYDYYQEFVDMTLGDTYIDDYIDKYHLNVYVVDKNDSSVDIFKNQEVYLEISGGPDYRAFILRDAYEEITGKDISTAPKAVRHTSKANAS